MKPVERYRELMKDLREHPSRYFDHRSPLALSTFLRGYEQGDPALCDSASVVHDVVVDRYPSAGSIRAGTVLYLIFTDLAEAYDLYISVFLEVLERPEVDIDPGEYQPLRASLKGFWPDLRARAPMLIGSWDVRDLYTFLQGFWRALDDCGHDTTGDRRDLDAFEKHLQTEIGSRGRWDRLLFAEDLGQGRSAARFVEVFEQWSGLAEAVPARGA